MVMGILHSEEPNQSISSSFYRFVSEARKLSHNLLKDHCTSHISRVRVCHYSCVICSFHIIVTEKIPKPLFLKNKMKYSYQNLPFNTRNLVGTFKTALCFSKMNLHEQELLLVVLL